MTSKYIDLTEEIWRADEGRTSFGSVGMVLAYLDEHPDQAPGRTITESAFREACEYEDQAHRASSPHTYAERVMFALGFTVVPDPEPSNAELIDRAYEIWDMYPQEETFGEYLDRHGWTKAPGGDDE